MRRKTGYFMQGDLDDLQSRGSIPFRRLGSALRWTKRQAKWSDHPVHVVWVGCSVCECATHLTATFESQREH